MSIHRRALPRTAKPQPTPEHVAFMSRRLLPFMSPDVGRYSIEHLMQEAYMQGMRDVLEILTNTATAGDPLPAQIPQVETQP